MPVRSLNSSVVKWPDRSTVDRTVRACADVEAKSHPELQRLGYFGSYARGDWGVGSDLDLVAVVNRSSEPFERRSMTWDSTKLPVPAELLVYTADERENLKREGGRFIRMLEREIIWVLD
jgi:hypothetical protein